MSVPDETWYKYLQCDEVTGLAVLDDKGEFVAEVQIDRDPDGDGYVAICVKPEMQGQNIASDALTALLQENFVQDLNRLVAFVARDNDQSKSVLEKSGFKTIGTEDQDGFVEYIYSFAS